MLNNSMRMGLQNPSKSLSATHMNGEKPKMREQAMEMSNTIIME